MQSKVNKYPLDIIKLVLIHDHPLRCEVQIIFELDGFLQFADDGHTFDLERAWLANVRVAANVACSFVSFCLKQP